MKKQRKSGILVHPSSFESKYGIGDFGKSAYNFIDFLEKSKQHVWQILPLGHTSFGDSPYQSFSTFAGNPLLISLDVFIENEYLDEKDFENIPDFNEIKVEYGKVIEFKNKMFKKAYEKFKQLKNKKIKDNFEKFCEENKQWLDDYSLFISLKNYFIQERKNTFESEEYKIFKKENIDFLGENGVNDCFYGASWNSWPKEIADRKIYALNKWKANLKDEIQYYKFLQFEFFNQWNKLKEYANSKEIEIIGDIPIFVACDSADTWSRKDLFFIDKKGRPTEVAGVPPDYFSKTGQLWGNPLYNWKAHKKERYEWWINRIKNTLKLVDIVRIDHFRGFESYWSIPYGEKTAIKGEWKKGPNKEIFDYINQNIKNAKIIAEDLGDLNEEVNELREKLNLPGMKILQFAFSDTPENEYLPHNFKDSNTIIYTGTHDNDTTLGWYNSIDEKSKDYIRRYMNISGDDICWDLIRLAFSSSADTAIIPIQDILCLNSDSRMNTPGNPSDNWQFRYKEEMLTDDILNRLKYLTELFNR